MHTISREELYEQVWARPMTKVAADYDVTSTALKKTCDRHKIPTPDRGYWAKLGHGKPVRKRPPLSKLTDTKFDRVHINGGPSESLSEEVRKAGTAVRERLQSMNLPDVPAAAAPADSVLKEPSILSATRRAISKGRPDAQGFKSSQGRGIVPLKVAPNSVDRVLQLLTRLFALAETEGYRPKISDNGLDLATEDVAIAFGVEERPRKTPHEPTAAELKRKEDNLRWGFSRAAWPQYDYSPSGRLAVVIHTNSWSGLRRSYSDGKTQSVEALLPEIIAGLAEHAAHLRERRRADEERERNTGKRKSAASGRKPSVLAKNAVWSLSTRSTHSSLSDQGCPRCSPIWRPPRRTIRTGPRASRHGYDDEFGRSTLSPARNFLTSQQGRQSLDLSNHQMTPKAETQVATTATPPPHHFIFGQSTKKRNSRPQ